MTWTPITFERLPFGAARRCQYPRQTADNPCGSKVPDHHEATYQKVTRRVIDGKVVDERCQYLCTQAMCAERIKLNVHRDLTVKIAPVPPRTHSPAPADS